MTKYQVLPSYLSGLAELNIDELPKYLDKIRRTFDVQDILNDQIDAKDVVEYYEQSYLGYSIFHSDSGAVHMSLNFDGKFDPDGYYGQARIVQEHVRSTKPQHVLELASGRGFNSKFLVDQNDKSVQFTGIDLTPKHVAASQDLARDIPNLSFEQGDFHNLAFSSEQFDLAFVIESLCYATDMTKALSEAHRVLSTNGRFIVIDGFRKNDLQKFDANLQLASRLTEKTMAVPRGWVITDWISLAQDQGFKVLEVRDISEAIMPNLLRFHVMAKGFFKIGFLSRLLVKAFPPQMIKNAIAGLLMPYTVSFGVQGYYVVVLERE